MICMIVLIFVCKGFVLLGIVGLFVFVGCFGIVDVGDVDIVGSILDDIFFLLLGGDFIVMYIDGIYMVDGLY